MLPNVLKISCTILVSLLFLNELHAQIWSAGTSYSYAGIGIVCQHDIDADTFAGIQLRAETMEMFGSVSGHPGISASFVWNMVFAETRSRNGNDVRFFAGPGICTGYAGDTKGGPGGIFGLKGSIGGECRFSRGVCISVGISPVFGAHLTVRNHVPHMKLYTNGLMYGLMPEISIRYMFR